MVPKDKITGNQLGLLLLPLVVATAILSVPAYVTEVARQDAWMSIALSSLTGYWSGLLMVALAKRHPGKTIVEYGYQILGKWFGTLFALYLAYVLFLLVSIVVGE